MFTTLNKFLDAALLIGFIICTIVSISKFRQAFYPSPQASFQRVVSKAPLKPTDAKARLTPGTQNNLPANQSESVSSTILSKEQSNSITQVMFSINAILALFFSLLFRHWRRRITHTVDQAHSKFSFQIEAMGKKVEAIGPERFRFESDLLRQTRSRIESLYLELQSAQQEIRNLKKEIKNIHEQEARAAEAVSVSFDELVSGDEL